LPALTMNMLTNKLAPKLCENVVAIDEI